MGNSGNMQVHACYSAYGTGVSSGTFPAMFPF